MRMSDQNLKRLATVKSKTYASRRYYVHGTKTRCLGAKAVSRIVNNVQFIARTALAVYVSEKRPKVLLEVSHIQNDTQWL